MKPRIFKSGLAVLAAVLMWAGLVSISQAANLYRDNNDPTTATANTLYFGTDTAVLTAGATTVQRCIPSTLPCESTSSSSPFSPQVSLLKATRRNLSKVR